MRGIYLRISVTDRCNLRCFYCYPSCYKKLRHSELMTYEEITKFVRILSRICNLQKIRITGGEPLVRKGVEKLLEMLKATGMEEIYLTTNGVLLSRYIRIIKGLIKRINVSLDTLKKEKFESITGRDALKEVLKGIEEALHQEVPVKINTVIMKGVNDDEIEDLIEFASKSTRHIRFIEHMPFKHTTKDEFHSLFIPAETLIQQIKKDYTLVPLQSFGVSKDFLIPELDTTVGFITPVSDPFCNGCNRIRLTSNGDVKLCLHSDPFLNIKKMMRNPDVDERFIEGSLKRALRAKGHVSPRMGSSVMINTGG